VPASKTTGAATSNGLIVPLILRFPARELLYPWCSHAHVPWDMASFDILAPDEVRRDAL
jgi:hypothetical protein